MPGSRAVNGAEDVTMQVFGCVEYISFESCDDLSTKVAKKIDQTQDIYCRFFNLPL